MLVTTCLHLTVKVYRAALVSRVSFCVCLKLNHKIEHISFAFDKTLASFKSLVASPFAARCGWLQWCSSPILSVL